MVSVYFELVSFCEQLMERRRLHLLLVESLSLLLGGVVYCMPSAAWLAATILQPL
jgi:hypothetical protein